MAMMARTAPIAKNNPSHAGELPPTPDEVMALIDATDDPRAARQKLATFLDYLDAPEGRPLTAATVWTIPLPMLLERVGIELCEVELTEVPDSLQDGFHGIILGRRGAPGILAMPSSQDTEEREKFARRLIWHYLNKPAQPGGSDTQ